jgi:ribosomal protein L11 methyltransferase
MATWRELVFTVAADRVDAWSDALLDAGALSVQAEDADADSPDEQAIFGEPGLPAAQVGWRNTRLRALLDTDAVPAALLGAAAATLGEPPPADPVIADFDDRDWVRASQAQFGPMAIGNRLVITPTWHAETPIAVTAKRLVLDPGLAFGTGSHPTTRMCLQWLEREVRGGERVIDYGCGSGILAIAAALLGAGEVLATDIDPQAMASARDNARANGVPVQVVELAHPLGQADIVLANILANPLRVLAPALTALLRPGGHLVLAGLLERQVDEIVACYPEVALATVDALEGWACLAGPRGR